MAFAKTELDHKTILGPIDKTIHDFLKDAPYGSELDVTGEDSAEIITVIDFPRLKEATDKAKRETKRGLLKASKAINNQVVVFKEGLTASPVVGTFQRAPKH